MTTYLKTCDVCGAKAEHSLANWHAIHAQWPKYDQERVVDLCPQCAGRLLDLSVFDLVVAGVRHYLAEGGAS